MNFKLLTEKRLEFLSLTGGCTGSSESTLVKMPHCCKSHVVAFDNFEMSSSNRLIRAKRQKKICVREFDERIW